MALTEEQRTEIQREVAARFRELLESNLKQAGPLTNSRDIFQPATLGADPAPIASGAPHEAWVRIVARAAEVLGTSEKALRWLNSPIRSLGDQTPMSLLESPEGIERVEDALGRIQHGVW